VQNPVNGVSFVCKVESSVPLKNPHRRRSPCNSSSGCSGFPRAIDRTSRLKSAVFSTASFAVSCPKSRRNTPARCAPCALKCDGWMRTSRVASDWSRGC